MQVTEAIEQEYENPFAIHVTNEKLLNISSDDDIAENIVNAVDVRKSRMKDFRQEQLISKGISFHAPIKKRTYKSFRYVLRNMPFTKKDGNVKVKEVNRNIIGILNSYIFKIEKPVDFIRALPYALFPVHLSTSNPDESRRYTAKSKLNDVLLQRLENNTYEVSSRIFNCCRRHCINKYPP